MRRYLVVPSRQQAAVSRPAGLAGLILAAGAGCRPGAPEQEAPARVTLIH